MNSGNLVKDAPARYARRAMQRTPRLREGRLESMCSATVSRVENLLDSSELVASTGCSTHDSPLHRAAFAAAIMSGDSIPADGTGRFAPCPPHSDARSTITAGFSNFPSSTRKWHGSRSSHRRVGEVILHRTSRSGRIAISVARAVCRSRYDAVMAACRGARQPPLNRGQEGGDAVSYRDMDAAIRSNDGNPMAPAARSFLPKLFTPLQPTLQRRPDRGPACRPQEAQLLCATRLRTPAHLEVLPSTRLLYQYIYRTRPSRARVGVIDFTTTSRSPAAGG